MRVLLIDHGCRGDRSQCDHPDAEALEAHGAQVMVAEASGLFPRAVAALGLDALAEAREAVRQAIDVAVDRDDPDVILVLHAGAIADLAVETGVPVVVHVAMADLEAVVGESIRGLVASSLSAADVLAAADTTTAHRLVADGWTFDDADVQVVPAGDGERLIAACRRAVDRRRGG